MEYYSCYSTETRVSHSWGVWGFNLIEAVLAKLRVFDPEMFSISCTNIPYILSQYNLTSKLLFSGPTEAAHVGGGAPFTP